MDKVLTHVFCMKLAILYSTRPPTATGFAELLHHQMVPKRLLDGAGDNCAFIILPICDSSMTVQLEAGIFTRKAKELTPSTQHRKEFETGSIEKRLDSITHCCLSGIAVARV